MSIQVLSKSTKNFLKTKKKIISDLQKQFEISKNYLRLQRTIWELFESYLRVPKTA